jgi:hypothetical protein
MGHLDQLRLEIDRATTEPYLLTVSDDGRPHCSCSEVTWTESGLITPAPRSWAGSEAAGHRQVTLLWPPAQPSGYSLIVDGTATRARVGGRAVLVISPTRAVRHRRGQTSGPAGSTCQSDCVPIFPA